MITAAFEAAALTGAFALSGSLDPLGFATIGLAILLLRLHGGHGRRLDPAVSEEAPMLVAAVCAAGIAGAAAAGFDDRAGRIAEASAIGAGLVTVARILAYSVVRRLRRRNVGLLSTLILGGGPLGAEIAETLGRSPEYGLRPVGFVDQRNGRDLPLPYLGSFPDLSRIAAEHQVKRLIVAFGPSREEDLVDIIRAWDDTPMEIYVVPRLFELGVGADGNADDVNGIPLVKLHRVAMRRPTWRLKRVVDASAAAIVLIVASPLLIAIAAAVRFSSPGPVLFRQKRVGRRGKPIEILKFRTMLVNEDADTTWSVNGDARQTRIGRFLRATHMDELPQLISVLKGDMSLVGPRPERPYYVDLFTAEIPRYRDRHRVPVGLTGWAQIHGLNGDTSIHDRARFDNRYIERWSLWRDLVILTRTGKAILSGVSTARRAERSARTVERRTRIIDLTDRAVPAAGGNANGNGHDANAHIPLDPLTGNGHDKAPAPDGTT